MKTLLQIQFSLIVKKKARFVNTIYAESLSIRATAARKSHGFE